MAIRITYYLADQLVAAAVQSGAPPFDPVQLNPLLSLKPGVNQYQTNAYTVPSVSQGDPVWTWVDERNPPGAPTLYGSNLSNSPGQKLYPGAWPGGGGVLLIQGLPFRYILPAAHALNDLTVFLAGVYLTDTSQLLSVVDGPIFNDNNRPSGIAWNMGGQDGAAPPFKGGFNGWWGGTGAPPAGYQTALLDGPQFGPIPVVLTGRFGASKTVIRCNGVPSADLGAAYGTMSTVFYHGFDTGSNVPPNTIFLRRAYVFSTAALTDGDVANIEAFMLTDMAGMNLYPSTWPLILYTGDSLVNGPSPAPDVAADTWPARQRAALGSPVGYITAAVNSGTIAQIRSNYIDSGDLAAHLVGARSAPKLAYVLMGHNDFIAGRTATQVFDDTKSAAAVLTAAGATVCIVSVPPSTGFPITGGSDYQTYRAAFLADFPTASGHSYLTLPAGGVTYASAFLDLFSDPALADPSGSGYSDGTHFSSVGNVAVKTDAMGFTAMHGIT